MNYYITGADGFIGKHLCKYLEGNFIYRIKRNDLTGLEFVLESYPPDVVIHLAAYGNHYHQKNVNETIKANVFLLEDMIKLFRDTGMKKFYNISTSSVTLPVQTYYSLTKQIGEKLIEAEDERFVNVRPYSVYGEYEADHRFIPTVIRCLESGEEMELDPHAKHDWVYVEDFIKAMLNIEDTRNDLMYYVSGKSYNKTFPIGSAKCHTNLQIVNKLEKISGKKLVYKPKTLREYDTKDWSAPYGVGGIKLDDGLKKVYEFRRTNIRVIKEA